MSLESRLLEELELKGIHLPRDKKLVPVIAAIVKVAGAADHLDSCVAKFQDSPLACYEHFKDLHDRLADLSAAMAKEGE